jgi:hypothetical protein
MFPLPISTYIYAGLILFGLAGFGYGSYEHNKYISYRTEVESVAKIQEAKVESIEKQHELIKKGISNEYDAKLALLRNYYANGVRQPSTNSVSDFSDASSPAFDRATHNLLAECAQTTLQLTELQKWFTEVAKVE